MWEGLRIGAGLAIGPILGSFVTNWALRRARGEQALVGRSRCDDCQAPLSFLRTMPLIAYAVQRGRCGACRSVIDPLHPVGEIIGALVLAFAFLAPSPFEGLGRALVGFTLLSLAIIDLKTLRLPNALTALCAAGCLLLATLRGAVLEGVVCAAILTGLLLLLRIAGRRGDTPGIGLGDIKLAIGLGLWLGVLSSWALGLAALLALASSGLWRRQERKHAFGPAMAIAALLVGGARDLGLWTMIT